MSAAPGLLTTLIAAFESNGVELRAWGLAWARVTPTMVLVPAFGLRAVPGAVRAALGLALGAAVAPALHPVASSALPWPALLAEQAALGLPVALTAATALYVASMTGGVMDDLRAGRESAALPNVEPGATPLGALLAMLVAIVFLETGGPARVVEALADPALEFHGALARAAAQLAHGVEVAVAVAAPVVIASLVVEVAGALVARAASPAYVQPLLAPLRSLAILAVAALLFERMAELLALLARRSP
ncbi:MAG: flagellar biosynthetic protein FliR [Sorangiineae bacterium]|nr:flagellar biosynthetic protein FliR [Polyangiaceae bacterium]MEB2323300.1 flagellar biosynthetic protein FliR [Sorangiineae bacterium]